VIDATGKYIVPGLIDEHLHLDLNGSMIGANGDTLCIPNGITTACDGGTCGASNFPQFYNSNIIRYEAHTYSYLNVSTFGNKSLCIHEEDHDPADFRADLIEKMFRKYPDTLRGLKVRMCKGTLGDHGMSPLYRALEISEDLQSKGIRCPIVIHYDNLPANVTVEELFHALRPGDIAAHVYQTKEETIFLPDGSIHPAVRDARARGVLMDDCHGRVHWSIPHLLQAVKEDFLPDIISSDAVRISEYVRPGFSLLYAMCMLSAAGMSTEKILQCVTINPAKALGIQDRAGALKPGMPADVTVLDIVDAKREFADNYGNTIPGDRMFIPLLTMVDGRVAYRQIFF
jgi:dihydroorotase